MRAPDRAEQVSRLIASAIGGREKALSVEKASGGRFKRQRLQSWIDGETSPPVAELFELAKFLGKEPDYFLFAGPQSMVSVRKLDVLAAAGGGAVNDLPETEETLEFPLWMLQRLTNTARGRPERLSVIRSKGESMEPLIKSGALLLVDNGDKDHRTPSKPKSPWEHNDIYVFLQDNKLLVKRLRVDHGSTLAISENPSESPKILRRQDFKVLGRVIWWDNRL